MPTPAYNAAGQTSSGTSASTLTLSSFAAAAGSNRFLEVWVGTGSGSPAEPTGVTWGGQAMTKRGSAQSLGSFWNHVKYFIKEADFPGGATGDIVATWAGSHDERAISAIVHSDVDQTSPYRNGSQTDENDGATTTPSIDITSHADDVATAGVWAVLTNADITGISTTAGTERTDTGPIAGGFEIHSSSTVAGAGTATITWLVALTSGAPQHTGMLGDSLQGAGAANPTVSLVAPRLFYNGQTGIAITGTAFEASQGTGTVKISPTDNVADAGAVSQTITAWAATSITFTAVRSTLGQGTLYLFVTNNSGDSNASGYPVQIIGSGSLAWVLN